MIDDGSGRLRYGVRLLIKHPSIDPDLITKRLNLSPHVANPVGGPRKTPAGTLLSGVYDKSVWGYSVRVEGRKSFCEDMLKLIGSLEPHANFLSEIVKTDGTIDVIVHLPGDVNIGDLIPWQVLARLVVLKISFGIEVFPAFN